VVPYSVAIRIQDQITDPFRAPQIGPPDHTDYTVQFREIVHEEDILGEATSDADGETPVQEERIDAPPRPRRKHKTMCSTKAVAQITHVNGGQPLYSGECKPTAASGHGGEGSGYGSGGGTRVPPNHTGWAADTTGSAVAITWRHSDNSLPCTFIEAGEGYVAVRWGGWLVVETYITPRLNIREYERRLDLIAGCINNHPVWPALVAGDFNAHSTGWGFLTTNSRG